MNHFVEEMEPGVVHVFRIHKPKAIVEPIKKPKKFSVAQLIALILLSTIITSALSAFIVLHVSATIREDLAQYEVSEGIEIINTEVVSLPRVETIITESVEQESSDQTSIEKAEIMDDVLIETLEPSPTGDTYTLSSLAANIPLADEYKAYIEQEAMEHGIPIEIQYAIGYVESRFDIEAISSTSDYGLFQINSGNFASLSNIFGYDVGSVILDVEVNTDMSIFILCESRDNYSTSDWHSVLMRYNMGPGTTAELNSQGIYSSEYSRMVIAKAYEYGWDGV